MQLLQNEQLSEITKLLETLSVSITSRGLPFALNGDEMTLSKQVLPLINRHGYQAVAEELLEISKVETLVGLSLVGAISKNAIFSETAKLAAQKISFRLEVQDSVIDSLSARVIELEQALKEYQVSE